CRCCSSDWPSLPGRVVAPGREPAPHPAMGPLGERLARRIAATGPITLADYMAAVLTDPTAGYYTTRDPFGPRGDFVTAPEISQMFGELIGLWCVEAWQRLGAPAPVRLVELGPGRGTLLADALRAACVVPPFLEAVRLHLVELSPTLRAAQAETLAGSLRDRPAAEPTWHDDLSDLPDGPFLLVANEFFDALPIRQFERRPEGWHERVVTLTDDGRRFAFGLVPADAAAAVLVPPELREAEPGTLVEASPAAIGVAAEIGRRIAETGGFALIVDYGHAAPRAGASLQALRGHERHDPLAEPGSADLTAHVDFSTLARAAGEAGARAHGPVAQAAFLRALGIEQRAARLRARATPAQAEAVESALERLVGPDAMGELFKVLALGPRDAPAPAGFA
ncbi:MAG TPA: SAM-dependent methyltransferase, partial [Kiloniellales bacterium]|nr:SAM-dependent methyltransferase [Kiloniellales bacterium]